MEFETTSNGFILKVNADFGPTIEWNANEGEVTLLLPILDKDGRLDADSRRSLRSRPRRCRVSGETRIWRGTGCYIETYYNT